MAAYGALVSVIQIMDQLHRHPHPPISLDVNQSESLTANVTFLQEFLEAYNPARRSYSSEADPFESRIAEAAYAAEDVIESYIVDQIHARLTDDSGKISSTEFYKGMEKVIEEMDAMKMEIIEKKMKEGVQIIQKQSTADAASLRSSSTTAQKVTTMVGLDEVLYEMLDKITGGARVRQIIPIVGMGGLGKTTLARNIYANPLVKERFDICAWSTVSQVHDARKILTEILGQVVDGDGEEDLSDGELGLKLYKHLMGKRYLMVMDDMWTIEAWDKVRSFFPENENGSRVVVTTRLSNLASKFNYSDGLDMKLLDEASSWNLFQRTVFGEETCPLELEDIGKKIVEGCRGLPLSIVVVGGLLSKSKATRGNWQVIEENLNSVVNSEDNERCLQILYMSYSSLPAYLKPCFLYLGIFARNGASKLPVFMFIQLWIAEGFIKPNKGKSLEEAAEKYLEELIDRNLLLVEERDHCGKLESFKVHDLLGDLAVREAQKDKFLYLLEKPSIHDFERLSPQRRITGDQSSDPLIQQSLESASLVRSAMAGFQLTLLSNFKLLRVCLTDHGSESSRDSEGIFVPLVNLRLLFTEAIDNLLLTTPYYLIYSLWNLQTLFLGKATDNYKLDIWRLPLIRYVMLFDGSLQGSSCLRDRDPLDDDDDDDDDKGEVVLENLHTLGQVNNLKLGEGVLRLIPNIKMLMLYYSDSMRKQQGDYYCLNNLHLLSKLQDLHLIRGMWDSPSMQELILPPSLKKLLLKGTELPWEEMTSKIGCLPLLQVLELEYDAFVGSEWETVEGQFSSLKFLKIGRCNDLEQWVTDDNTHFPRLECLVLRELKRLREIPSSIGDVPTLGSVRLEFCSDAVVESGQRIVEEQEELGNEDIELQVIR